MTYFHGLARLAATHFVQKGSLGEGERFQYKAAAYPDRMNSHSAVETRFAPEEVEPEVAYDLRNLADYMAGAVPEGVVDAGDMPVFIPQHVLEEVEVATLSAGVTETGGILLGHLRHDANLPEIFAEVTAQIPTQVTGETAKITFDAETWTAVRAAVDIRNRREIYLGFWHSHPVRAWCSANECSLEKQRNCPLAKGFFSRDDQALFRTVFPRGYSVALLCSDVPLRKPLFSLFGWRHGMIEPRGFHVSANSVSAPARDSGES